MFDEHHVWARDLSPHYNDLTHLKFHLVEGLLLDEHLAGGVGGKGDMTLQLLPRPIGKKDPSPV